VALGLVMASSASAQTTLTIDTAHSSAAFSVRHMMVSNVKGTLGPVKGTATWDGKDVKTVKADVTIDATGLTTYNEQRDKHLKSPDFFDVEKNPTVTFKSKRVEGGSAGKFKLVGDLTMRGVTKEVVLDVEGPTPPITAQGKTRVGATASTKLNRQDYGVSWSRSIDGGGVVVGDEVTVTLELELVQQ
jgi:polyisoprenoid-binding protein YceI